MSVYIARRYFQPLYLRTNVYIELYPLCIYTRSDILKTRVLSFLLNILRVCVCVRVCVHSVHWAVLDGSLSTFVHSVTSCVALRVAQ